MTTTSRVPATIDYLVAAFTAASTLGAASPPVAVYDGPFLTDDSVGRHGRPELR